MTFREWILSKSTLSSGTLMQHLNTINTGVSGTLIYIPVNKFDTNIIINTNLDANIQNTNLDANIQNMNATANIKQTMLTTNIKTEKLISNLK